MATRLATKEQVSSPPQAPVSGLRRFRLGFARVFSGKDSEAAVRTKSKLKISPPTNLVQTGSARDEHLDSRLSVDVVEHTAQRSVSHPVYSRQTREEAIEDLKSPRQRTPARRQRLDHASALSSNPVSVELPERHSIDSPRAVTPRRNVKRASRQIVASTPSKSHVTPNRSRAAYRARRDAQLQAQVQAHMQGQRPPTAYFNHPLRQRPRNVSFDDGTEPGYTPSCYTSTDEHDLHNLDGTPYSNASTIDTFSTPGLTNSHSQSSLPDVAQTPFRVTKADFEKSLAEKERAKHQITDLEVRLADVEAFVRDWKPKSPHNFRPLMESLDEEQRRLNNRHVQRSRAEREARERQLRDRKKEYIYDDIDHSFYTASSADVPAPITPARSKSSATRPRPAATAPFKSALKVKQSLPATNNEEKKSKIGADPGPNPSYSPPDITHLPGFRFAQMRAGMSSQHAESEPRPIVARPVVVAPRSAESRPATQATAVRVQGGTYNAKPTEIIIRSKKGGIKGGRPAKSLPKKGPSRTRLRPFPMMMTGEEEQSRRMKALASREREAEDSEADLDVNDLEGSPERQACYAMLNGRRVGSAQ